MPDYIDILGLRYPISYVDCVNKTDPRKGEIDFLTNEIRIDRNMPRDLQEQTLLHEVIHAIGDALEIDELVQNENTVQSLASALYCTFKDRVILSDEIRIPFMIGDKKVKEIVTRTHFRSL